MSKKIPKTNFTDYYRLTKPGIIRGNLLNTTAGFLFVAQLDIAFDVLLATLLGTSLVIASSCVFNNYLDRRLDSKMERTKKRALVSGTIRVSHAMLFATLLGVLGFWVLATYTNTLTVLIGLLAMFMYVVIYGIAKRKSVHGTLVGSIPGALPPVAGYAAATNQLDLGALILFFILVFWQMPHFYAIAMYRIKDYKAAGLPVLPIKRGMMVAKKQSVIYTFLFLVACTALSVFGYAGAVFAVVMSITGLWWLTEELSGFAVEDDEAWARNMFGASLKVILILAIMLSVDPWLP